MKYYVSEVTRYFTPVNNKTEELGIYTYEDETLAIATYHQKMATAMKNANCSMELLDVKNEFGVMLVQPDRHEKPEPNVGE